ncbi:hypothetical protein [Legionella nautarum]|nr:hypothetical protein [Legionella nautarum]
MKLTTKILDKDGNPVKFFVVTKDVYMHQHEIIDCEGKQLGYVTLAEERLGAPTYKKYLIIGQLHNTSPNQEYRNVGTALHELVFRLSFSEYFQTNGNIMVDIGYQSLLFHYDCGFRLHPQYVFEWDCLGEKFLNHELYGKAAYEEWRLSHSDLLESDKPSANDVLAFYHFLYKENNDQTRRACLRKKLAKLGGLCGYLSQAVVPQKKEEFSIDIAPVSQSSSPSTLFYSTNPQDTKLNNNAHAQSSFTM